MEGTSGRSFEGTGIGLALTLELVKVHGGTITTTSRVGHGTCFRINIPLGTSHLPPDRIVESTPERLSLGQTFVEEALRWLPSESKQETTFIGKMVSATGEDSLGLNLGHRAKILLADDNADMRDYVNKLLGKQFDVQVVCDGKEAVEAALMDKPDLILSDVMMPHMDGFQVIQALRADPRTTNVPIILLSARAGEEARVEGLHAGADDYLVGKRVAARANSGQVKPFSAKELVARVKTHLELGKLRADLEKRVEARTADLIQTNAALQTEIQERKQIEEALRLSEERFRVLAKAAPVGIIQTDINVRRLCAPLTRK